MNGEARIAALDIGGANLKAAHSSGGSAFVPFALWRRPDGLSAAIEDVLRSLPAFDLLAVTMTAELCDAYETKRQGVLAVLDAAERAARTAAGSAAIQVFRLDGRLAPIEAARSEPLLAASANWLALALRGATLLPRGRSVVADTGSTTTDIVPVRGGEAVPGGRTDLGRLLLGELVYTGVRRTPVLAVAAELPYRDRSCPVAAESFATMLDAYLTTGDLRESPAEGGAAAGTADGRPQGREWARDRLARMVCADRETFTADDALQAARFLAAAQEGRVRKALLGVAERLGGPIEAAVVSGEGEFLLRRALHRLWPRCEVVSLAERFGPEASRSACAHALVAIAREPAKYPPRAAGTR